jgi:metalloendopeptidase OMA1, mitochondrial
MKRPMHKPHSRLGVLLGLSLAVLLAASSCSTVPITGRRSFNLIPDSEATQLGATAYQQVLQQNKIINSGPEYDQVMRVGHRIAEVANEPSFDWQFTLIDDPKTANAFCLPGGKVAVYSGILPITQSDEGLAVVVAHEIGHAVAKHGSERLTDELALQLGQMTVGQLIQSKSPATQNVVMAAYGAGATLGVMLPFSRAQESEADHIGLILMARAGYDPTAAPAFWQRMIASEKGARPPAFLSDHPTDQQRVKQLQAWMPQAEKEYRARYSNARP